MHLPYWKVLSFYFLNFASPIEIWQSLIVYQDSSIVIPKTDAQNLFCKVQLDLLFVKLLNHSTRSKTLTYLIRTQVSVLCLTWLYLTLVSYGLSNWNQAKIDCHLITSSLLSCRADLSCLEMDSRWLPKSTASSSNQWLRQNHKSRSSNSCSCFLPFTEGLVILLTIQS